MHLDGRRISNEVSLEFWTLGNPGLDLFRAPHLPQGQTRSGKTLPQVVRDKSRQTTQPLSGCDITGLSAPFHNHMGNEYCHTGTANIQGHVDALRPNRPGEMDRRIEC